LTESIEDAAWRCLDEEVGLQVDDPGRRRQIATLRDTRFLATLALPPDRRGERPVADDVGDGPLSLVELRAKAYWLTTLLFRSQSDVSAVANGREVDAVEWCTLAQARQRIVESARPEKAEVLEAALEHAERTLPDTHPVPVWQPEDFIVHGRFCDSAFIVSEIEQLRSARGSNALILIAYRESTLFRPLLRIAHHDSDHVLEMQELLTKETRITTVAGRTQRTPELVAELVEGLPLDQLGLSDRAPSVLLRTEQSAPRTSDEPSLPVARPASIIVLAFSGKEARNERAILDRLLLMVNATAPVIAHRELESHTHLREQLASLERRWQTKAERSTVQAGTRRVSSTSELPDSWHPDGYATMLLDLALRVTNSSVGNLYMVNREATRLKLVAQRGNEKLIRELHLDKKEPPSVVVRVYKRGRAIITNDVVDYRRLNGYISVVTDPELEPYAELAVPIDQGPFASSVPPGRAAPPPPPIGVINVERVRPRDSAAGAYTPSDLASLQTVAFLYALRRAGSLTAGSAESLARLTQLSALGPIRAETAPSEEPMPADIPRDLIPARKGLEAIVMQIYNFTRSTSVTIRVFTPDQSGLVRFVAAPRQRLRDDQRVIPIGSHESVNVVVARSGLPRYIPDLAVQPTAGVAGLDGILKISGRPAPRSELCLPIAVHGRIVGTLNLESLQRSNYTDDVTAVVTALAAQAGLVIAQARRHDEWRLFSYHASQTRKAHRVLRHTRALGEWLEEGSHGMSTGDWLAARKRIADIEYAADPERRPSTTDDKHLGRHQAALGAIDEAIKRSRVPERVECRGRERLSLRLSELAADVLTIAITELLRNAGQVVSATSALPFAIRLRCQEVRRATSKYVRIAVTNQILEPLNDELVQDLYRRAVRQDRLHVGAYMIGSYVRSVGGAIWVAENGRPAPPAGELDDEPMYFTVALEIPERSDLAAVDS